MHRSTSAKWFRKSFSRINASSTTIALIYAACLKADIAKVDAKSHSAAAVVRFFQGTAWWGLPLLLFLAALSSYAAAQLADPASKKTIALMLDEFREEVFGRHERDPQHYHRVTLFQHKRWNWRVVRLERWSVRFSGWPWEGWLIPYMRSGYTTQKTKIRFLAPDAADRAVGVAGRTWSVRKPVVVQNLPDVSPDAAPPEEDITAYSTEAFVTQEWIMRERPHARSLIGFPVEKRGEPWGVIVLDSRSPNSDVECATTRFRAVAKILGSLVEEA